MKLMCSVLYFNGEFVVVKNIMMTGQLDAVALIPAKELTLLHYQYKCQQSKKDK